MGAYLYFKCAKRSNTAALKLNEFLYRDEFNKKLQEVDAGFFVFDETDVQYEIDNGGVESSIEYCRENIGQNSYKVSSIEESIEKLQIESDDFFEQVTQMFERINHKFKMKYLARSCAFGSCYFNDEQIMRMTNNGALLSGSNKKSLLSKIHTRSTHLLQDAVAS